jgi:hypothetical protein
MDRPELVKLDEAKAEIRKPGYQPIALRGGQARNIMHMYDHLQKHGQKAADIYLSGVLEGLRHCITLEIHKEFPKKLVPDEFYQ